MPLANAPKDTPIPEGNVNFEEATDKVLRMDAFCGAVGLLVPPLRHEQVMKELHDTSPGITLMKALARSLVWWSNVDADFERMVQSCSVSRITQLAPPPSPHKQTLLHPCEYLKSPWFRLHIHYAGPLFGRMYLIALDALFFSVGQSSYHSHSLIWVHYWGSTSHLPLMGKL